MFRLGESPVVRVPRSEAALEASDGIDVASAVAAWERALAAPPWDGQRPVWIHADLLRPNLPVVAGRLDAVPDFGSSGAGDPAADVISAWTVCGRVGREAYLTALEVDEGTVERARGFALIQAALIIPYYAKTNLGWPLTRAGPSPSCSPMAPRSDHPTGVMLR